MEAIFVWLWKWLFCIVNIIKIGVLNPPPSLLCDYVIYAQPLTVTTTENRSRVVTITKKFGPPAKSCVLLRQEAWQVKNWSKISANIPNWPFYYRVNIAKKCNKNYCFNAFSFYSKNSTQHYAPAEAFSLYFLSPPPWVPHNQCDYCGSQDILDVMDRS